VRNKDGRIVFAVYNEGVRVYVDDGLAGKALEGGFAIGGFDKAKGTSLYLNQRSVIS
jgi:trimeric autotransporter adhesin